MRIDERFYSGAKSGCRLQCHYTNMALSPNPSGSFEAFLQDTEGSRALESSQIQERASSLGNSSRGNPSFSISRWWWAFTTSAAPFLTMDSWLLLRLFCTLPSNQCPWQLQELSFHQTHDAACTPMPLDCVHVLQIR